jgi:hypothetical protein
MANNFPNLRPTLNLDMVNGIYVDSRITFTRAGGRTFFDDEMVKAEENLFTGSNSLNTGWSVLDATNVTGQADPFAGTTAISLVGNGVLGRPRQVRAITSPAAGTVMTTSVFAKAGTESFLQILYAGNSRSMNCNLTTGAFAVEGGASGTAVDVGGGWWRFSHTFVATSASDVQFAIISGIGDARATSITTSGNILLYGAQLEQRSFVTAYTATTTQPITRYQRLLKTAAANEWPREFDPVTGECLGRSVWESRTNLLLRSEEFDNASWAKAGGASQVIANQAIAPDGVLSADKMITSTTTNVTWGFNQSHNYISGTQYTQSIYAKKGERNHIIIQSPAAVTGAAQARIFNLTDGSSTQFLTLNNPTNWGFTQLGNGWIKVFITFTATATVTSTATYALSNGTTNTFVGDGVSGIYIWGAQLEAGAFATPYIPTVASQVTRVADSAVMTGVNFSSWFNPSEGTLFVDGSAPGAVAAAIATLAEGVTATNRIFVSAGTAGVSSNIMFAVAGGLTQVSLLGTPTTSNKVAGSYLFNDYKACLNGGTVGTDTVALVPVVDNLRLGQTVGTTFSGYYRRVTYYPQALTAANLQAITR